MPSPTPDRAFEIAFFAIVEDLGLRKEELVEAGERVSFSLDNTYREYLAAPEERRLEILGRYAQLFVEHVRNANKQKDAPPPTYTIQDIFPILRPRAYFVHTELRGQLMSQGKPLASRLYLRPFTPHFSIGLVADDGKKMNILTEQDLSAFPFEPDEIYEQALNNLRQEQPLTLARLNEVTFVSNDAGYGYDASLLLLPEFAEQIPFEGTPAAFATNSSRLFVTSLESLSSENMVMELVVQSFQTHHHPISVAPFILTDESWKESADITGDPFLKLWRRSWVKERLDDIHAQQAILAQLQPEKTFPKVDSLGIDVISTAAEEETHGHLSQEELQKTVVTVTATDAPAALNEPFFLTDVIQLPSKNGPPKTLLLRTLMLELPGVIQTDDRYEPRLAHFTRNLTSEEVALIEEKQKPELRAMGSTKKTAA